MVYIWLGIIILLTLIELMTVNLTTIWFVISGLVALGVSFINDSFLVQFGWFAVLGIILLVITRPLLQKWLVRDGEKTNLDRVVGMEGVVTEEITRKHMGEVKVDGKKWTAFIDTGRKIKVGCTVRVLAIDGVKLKVEEVEE